MPERILYVILNSVNTNYYFIISNTNSSIVLTFLTNSNLIQHFWLKNLQIVIISEWGEGGLTLYNYICNN